MMNEETLKKEIYKYIKQATEAGLDVKGDQYESSVTFKADDSDKYKFVLSYSRWNKEQTFEVCRFVPTDQQRWHQEEPHTIFKKNLFEFFGNYFTNPFKPTNIEYECFELETGVKWPIKPEEDEVK